MNHSSGRCDRVLCAAAPLVGALALFVASCRASTPAHQQPLPPGAAVTPVRSAGASYRTALANVAGRWTGRGKQDDGSTWTIDMRLRAGGKIGWIVGDIAYPSLGCRGYLVRRAAPAGWIAMQERLTTNPRCVDGGEVRVRRDGARLRWRWLYPNGKAGASATLRAAR